MPRCAKLAIIARSVGAHVLVDEVYLDAVYENTPRTSFHLGPEFVVTNSLTKVYGLSGLRCGWILAQPDLADKMWRLNDLFGSIPAHPAELLSVIAFQHLDKIRARARTIVEADRAALTTFLTLKWAPATLKQAAVKPKLKVGMSRERHPHRHPHTIRHYVIFWSEISRREPRERRRIPNQTSPRPRHQRRPRPLLRHARSFPYRYGRQPRNVHRRPKPHRPSATDRVRPKKNATLAACSCRSRTVFLTTCRPNPSRRTLRLERELSSTCIRDSRLPPIKLAPISHRVPHPSRSEDR